MALMQIVAEHKRQDEIGKDKEDTETIIQSRRLLSKRQRHGIMVQ
jgi:hypothetical protein